jgi:hypothetical protein
MPAVLDLPGIVLCRSAEFVSPDDSIVSGDTIQMVPIPKGAKVLQLQVYYSDLPDGCTGCDIGYGGDADAFIISLPMTGQNVKSYPGCVIRTSLATGDIIGLRDNPVGLLHTFTADDTIDISFQSLPTKIPTSQHIKMAVWYKMTGTIKDET